MSSFLSLKFVLGIREGKTGHETLKKKKDVMYK